MVRHIPATAHARLALTRDLLTEIVHLTSVAAITKNNAAALMVVNAVSLPHWDSLTIPSAGTATLTLPASATV